jgi:hypothetical protein
VTGEDVGVLGVSMIWFLDSYGGFLLSITSSFCFSLGFICMGLGVWWSRGLGGQYPSCL